MATFYRLYAFNKKDYKNKLIKIVSQNKKVVRVHLPEKYFNSYEIIYTDDFEKQRIAEAEAKRKKYYEDRFNKIFRGE